MMNTLMNKHFLISSEMGAEIQIEPFDTYTAAFEEMKRRVDDWNDSDDISFTNNTASVYNNDSMWTNKYRIINLEELMKLDELMSSIGSDSL